MTYSHTRATNPVSGQHQHLSPLRAGHYNDKWTTIYTDWANKVQAQYLFIVLIWISPKQGEYIQYPRYAGTLRIEEHETDQGFLCINRDSQFSSKVRHTIHNSSQPSIYDYLLSRRRIIGGNNPSISLTVFVVFLVRRSTKQYHSIDTRKGVQTRNAQLLYQQ